MTSLDAINGRSIQMPDFQWPIAKETFLIWFSCMYISKRYWDTILSISFLLTLIQSSNHTSLSLCSFMLQNPEERGFKFTWASSAIWIQNESRTASAKIGAWSVVALLSAETVTGQAFINVCRWNRFICRLKWQFCEGTLDMKLLREMLKYTLGDNGRCHPTITGRGFWPSTRHPVFTKTNIFFRLWSIDLEESKQVFK